MILRAVDRSTLGTSFDDARLFPEQHKLFFKVAKKLEEKIEEDNLDAVEPLGYRKVFDDSLYAGCIRNEDLISCFLNIAELDDEETVLLPDHVKTLRGVWKHRTSHVREDDIGQWLVCRQIYKFLKVCAKNKLAIILSE